MTKIAITVDEKSTKADEIGALQMLATHVPAGTYLASLFSPQFVEWAAGLIRQDIAPDAMSAIQHCAHVGREASARIAQLEALSESNRRAAADRLLDVQFRDKTIHELQGKLLAACEARDVAEDALKHLVFKLENMAAKAWLSGQAITPELVRDLGREVGNE